MSISKRTVKAVSAAKGAVLVVAMRWVDRLIGVCSTLILARLLVPEDFGIVAMASVVVGLIDTLLDLGVGVALVQDRKAAREEYDTAWTLRLIQAGVGASLIWLAAPFAADYFRDARVVEVMRFMALTILVGGGENIGIVAFQKNMEFGKEFQFFFFRRMVGFLVTVVLAFSFQSYWAMVFGAFAGRLAAVSSSYWLHDFRPRLSLARAGKMWSFSQWVLVRNLGAYGQMQLDKFLVGRRSDATTLGAYTLADEISAMPTTEILAPLGRVLFPVFVRVASDAAQLRLAFCKAIGVQSLVALPAGVGLALVAEEAVLFLLGEKWRIAIPMVQALALIGVFNALNHSSGYLLLAIGQVRLQALLAWLQLALLALLALLVFPDVGVLGIAYLRLATAAVGLFVIVGLVLAAVKEIKIIDFIFNTWRPILATAMMSLVLVSISRFEFFGRFWKLAILIVAGAMAYGAAVALLWRLGGCSEGAESYLLEQVRMKEKILKWMRVRS